MFPEFSAQPAAANAAGSRGGAPGGAAGHSGRAAGTSPAVVPPGACGIPAFRGETVSRREAPRACGCLEMLRAAGSEGAGAGAGGRADVM